MLSKGNGKLIILSAINFYQCIIFFFTFRRYFCQWIISIYIKVYILEFINTGQENSSMGRKTTHKHYVLSLTPGMTLLCEHCKVWTLYLPLPPNLSILTDGLEISYIFRFPNHQNGNNNSTIISISNDFSWHHFHLKKHHDFKILIWRNFRN